VLRHDFGLSSTWAFAALILLLPVILAVAWGLFVLVERYTLTSRPVEVSGLAAAILFPRLRRRKPPEIAFNAGSVPDSAGTIDPQARVNPHY
jgi:hypothetical protein